MIESNPGYQGIEWFSWTQFLWNQSTAHTAAHSRFMRRPGGHWIAGPGPGGPSPPASCGRDGSGVAAVESDWDNVVFPTSPRRDGECHQIQFIFTQALYQRRPASWHDAM